MITLLSKLQVLGPKKKKRLGRGLGSGKGAKSGRGTTRHQKARKSIPIHFEGGQGRMVKKFPLLRGKGRNKSFNDPKTIIKLDRLNCFNDGDLVDMKSLVEKKLIKKTIKITNIKILTQGKLIKKLIIKLPVSQSAKKIIEKLGGKVETK